MIFIIRTRRNPSRSRPNAWLTTTSLAVVIMAAALPFTPVSGYLGFVAPPSLFFVILLGLVCGYLMAAEIAKRWFTGTMRHLDLLHDNCTSLRALTAFSTRPAHSGDCEQVRL